MNPLDAMQVFVRVAEMASFTRAADSLGVPRASVSLAVQQLENRVGARLLQRTTRRVQLTPDGQAFLGRCQDLLADMDELDQMFRDDETGVHGRLRVDLPLAVARDLVMPRLPDFLAQHPGIALELGSTDRRVDLVAEGFDCVLRVGPLVDSSLVARHLGYFRQGNCASPAYLERHGVPVSPEALAGHRIVHYSSTLGDKPAGFEYIDPASGELRVHRLPASLVVNNSDAYRAACLAGLGIIQAPVHGMQPLLESGQLVEILPGYRAPALPVTLLYGNRRHLAKRVRLFMHWLAEVLQASLYETPG
ncbi:MAG: LysR family transcriptional regulator [Dechloromonas sp.]|nr:MAG: LysR family transcriptional regulator [Dechloromonas sp.]